MQQHMDTEVQRALDNLNAALCNWERDTGRQSVLILREEHGYEYRSVNGKPDTSGAPDQCLMAIIESA
jgi:hypothetical protein